MKTYKIAIAFLAAISLASCIREDAPYSNNAVKKGMGILEMDVNADTPSNTTKALYQVTDYPVIIKDADGNIVREWDKAEDVPDTVHLSVGNYVIESHTPGLDKPEKKMDKPFYAGAKDIEIVQYHTTEAEVICKMLNTRISIVYGPKFEETFKNWSITLHEGNNTVNTITHDTHESEQVFYWYFQQNVNTITMDFYGVTAEDNRVIEHRFSITKDNAEHSGYDGDETHFTGGDALTFTFTPVYDDKGQIGPITIVPSIDFTDDGNPDDFTVNVEDVTEGGEEGGGESGGTGDPANITLDIPEPMTLEFDGDGNCITDPAQGNVNITATKGIKSLIVKISSDNSEFMEILDGMAEENQAMSLATGCEVVGNTSLQDLFEMLEQEAAIPAEGDKQYTFPVGNFFVFLAGLPGTHNFEMNVTDMEGASKSETVVITVPGGEESSSDDITLEIPEPMTLEFDGDGNCITDPAQGNVNITATKGIKSLIVKISSDNSEFMEILDGMAEENQAMSLATGCEVVGNTSLQDLFEMLEQEAAIPAEGDKQYTFPVGNFFVFLAGLPGTHNFEMKVTDMEGAVKSGTVIITVPKVE
ncbi:MAG: DUF4493 domain-containing protein [Bacteroidales bacterium]|nr:DUF4493 domain-containing protein [Bacteroidales bacterium]